MAVRCLNKAMLIGNLTRDPELRYTPSGSAVCSFGVATNRYWATDAGEQKEDTQFHRIVAWNKLAEICSQLLGKGDKVYIEGRLQTRQWTGSDGVSRKTTEVVASEMILLRSQRGRKEAEYPEAEGEPEIIETPAEGALEVQAPAEEEKGVEPKKKEPEKKSAKSAKEEKKSAKPTSKSAEEENEDVKIPDEEMPF